MLRRAGLLALLRFASAASLADVKHVVMLMQENRSFMHYLGTLKGVRGFADPNVQINPNGLPVWYQYNRDVSSLTNDTDYLLPYWLNYLGGDWPNRTQCLSPGSNLWLPTQIAYNGGLNNLWPSSSAPQAWAYYKRQDIPFHYALADSFTVADHYQAGVMSATDPNRWMWQSGSINVPGGPQPLGAGGVVLDDNQTPGCEATDLNCVPLYWPATAEYYDAAGVDWGVFMNEYDYVTNNGLFYFDTFQNAPENSSLYQRGLAFSDQNSLDGFYSAAANGTLPEISWIFPPGAVNDGAWFMKNIVDAVTQGPNWDSTVLLICYDEGGGFGDTVWYHSPEGTAGEWFEDPYGELGYQFSGPGVRIPLFIISPFTRGGRVFTEHADHNSHILFVEQYLTAKGYENITTTQMSDWRRTHMSNLLNAFDFDNPDYSIPDLPSSPYPYTDDDGNIVGTYVACEATYSDVDPPVPYGNQTLEDSLYFEDGWKQVYGYLTEGHYLVFETNGFALTNPGTNDSSDVTTTAATTDHENISQRWILHALSDADDDFGKFEISSAADGRYITVDASLTSGNSTAGVFGIAYIGGGGYTLQNSEGKYLSVGSSDSLELASSGSSWGIYSVTYHS
ncbi:putative hemolytic phospholipase C precursor [Cryphonectria parasitica EP155]|uniref:Hemolytic phospholipase C n=1 Tax=Cryphonectria parasitica (strain ATCC 38755 / EP155) TaxID=660469 RepID=A0A9P5CHC9_CRYP1|nr:putative hemolytic phospholipase C precursor [Cryphonectria parasitica EP155]KAF3759903.1 putative hemolytic phospholipase C precursor [Cryphonectria parasitica EP155]